MTVAPSPSKRHVGEVVLEYGWELLSEHPSGIRLAADGVKALLQATQEIRSLPQWTVLLEGQCAVADEGPLPLYETIGEEAADLCKEQLQLQGVPNQIVCRGGADAQRHGVRVTLSLLEPAVGPSKAEVTHEPHPGLAETLGPQPPLEACESAWLDEGSQAVAAEGPADALGPQPLLEPCESAWLDGGSPARAVEAAALAASAEELQDHIRDAESRAQKEAAEEGASATVSHTRWGPVGIVVHPAAPVAGVVTHDKDWANVYSNMVRRKEDSDQELEHVDIEEFQLPAEGATVHERMTALETALQKLMPNGLAFDANKAEIQERNWPVVARLAKLLQHFPEFGLQCAGHAKGKPADNNLAKRALSQERARSVRDALQVKGTTNSVVCVGFGSSLGRGNCVRVHVMPPGEADERDAELRILAGNTVSLTVEQERASLDQMLREALEGGMAFEPNRATIQPQAATTVRRIAWILKAFPTWAVRCEGHAKGQPADNNDAKVQLSTVRAEAVRVALEQLHVRNRVVCVGHGCAQGLGMCVRMSAMHPEKDIEVPDLTGKSPEERRALLDELLARALERNIEFEPNKHEVPESALEVIRAAAHVLKAFPEAAIRCEGHAKGKPAENNDAKRRVSQARAEAVRTALQLEGVKNQIVCVGEGSAQGRGMRVKMFAIDPKQLRAKAKELEIPDTAGQSRQEQEEVANRLLAEALAKPVEFEPNSHALPTSAAETVRSVVRVLNAFPSLPVLCEGHAKGQPQDNNLAKEKLSHLRAESFKAALQAAGVHNDIRCVGRGCAEGRGMCVRMAVVDPAAAGALQVEIPPTAGLSWEERMRLLDELLAKALAKGISFEPNSADIQVTVADTIAEIARILQAFPGVGIRCEGHTKGQPADNSAAKVRLSQARAESVAAALKARGVQSEFECVGCGSAQGLGMCVRMVAREASGL